MTQPNQALDGIRVLDFTHALAGPYCTLLLGNYGAEVYKLETPEGGDLARGWGPPFTGKDSSFFLGLNRGKRGLSIDLKRPEGIDLCLRLLDRMDVLVENFRPGTMERLGLGYDAVHARNPGLVYCSVSGYGQSGPFRDEGAMDLIIECSSGLISLTGTEEGEQVRCGYSVADVNAGLFAVIGILMALQQRTRTRAGQHVDVSMFDSMISAMTSSYAVYLGSGQLPRPMGTSFPTVVPYRLFHASDREFAIAVGSEKLWAAFCGAIGRADLQRHPDYATNPLRVQNRGSLEATLQAIFGRRTAAEWAQVLGAAGVPCTVVLTFDEVVGHQQAMFREMFPAVMHPRVGSYRVTGSPVKLSRAPAKASTGAPLLGQDTQTALTQLLGLDPQTIARLTEERVILPNPLAEESAARPRRDA